MIVRTAVRGDADTMAGLLNDIIRTGGTTALEEFVDGDALCVWMARSPGQSTWVLAEIDSEIAGFQWTEPNPNLPDEASDIASFVRIGMTGKGVGRAMFEATKERCKALGYRWINAAIRSDNLSGLTYYARMGFYDWKSDPTIALSNGTVTGKTYKRFYL